MEIDFSSFPLVLPTRIVRADPQLHSIFVISFSISDKKCYHRTSLLSTTHNFDSNMKWSN